MNKKLFVTASLGKRDRIRPPQVVTKDSDYICYTDYEDEVIPYPWINIKTKYTGCPNRAHKKFKLQVQDVYKNYDIVIWNDANFILKDFDPLFKSLDDCDIVVFNHPERQCIYEEFITVIGRGLDDPLLCSNQYKRYRSEGLPSKLGLFEAGLMIYKPNNEKVQNFFNFWYNEVQNGSKRDQLSGMYSVWKMKPAIKILGISRNESPYHQWTYHGS